MLGFTAEAEETSLARPADDGGGRGEALVPVGADTANNGLGLPVDGLRLPAIHVDPNEMEDVRWFSRAQLRAALGYGTAGSGPGPGPNPSPPAGDAEWMGLSIPGRAAIAHSMIHEWLRAG